MGVPVCLIFLWFGLCLLAVGKPPVAGARGCDNDETDRFNCCSIFILRRGVDVSGRSQLHETKRHLTSKAEELKEVRLPAPRLGSVYRINQMRIAVALPACLYIADEGAVPRLPAWC